MLTNPDHARIKAGAAELLNTRHDTPHGKVKVFNEMLPIAQFENGLMTPNNRPPHVVYIELDGQQWRLERGPKKRWQRVSVKLDAGPPRPRDIFHPTQAEEYALALHQGNKRFGSECKHDTVRDGRCVKCLRRVVTRPRLTR